MHFPKQSVLLLVGCERIGCFYAKSEALSMGKNDG